MEEALRSWKTFEVAAYGAACYQCCGRKVNSFSLTVDDEICHPGMSVNQSRIDVEEVDSNIVVAALICVPVHANMPLGFGPGWFL